MPIDKTLIIPIIFLVIWEATWKAIALWRSARNNQMKWFVCIFIFNTIGILPIVYLKFFQKNDNLGMENRGAV